MIPNHFPKLPNDWEAVRSEIKSPLDGTAIAVTAWKKKNSDYKNVLQLSHGLGEHSARYIHFPHYLSGSLDAIVTWDHRGHGLSKGKKGDIPSFHAFLADTKEVRKTKVDAWFPNAAVHLFGHSMGGLIALRTVQSFPELKWASLTVSAPLIAMKIEVPWIKKQAGILLKNVLGGLALPSGLNAAHISHDPEVVRGYETDPLNHDKVTPRLFNGMLDAMREVQEDIGKIPANLPVMGILPTADLITDTDAALEFLKKLPNANKRVACLEGFYHESFNETGKEKAFGELSEWLKTLNHAGKP